MIPQDHLTHWRNVAPWSSDEHVEQDLLLSRALVDIFNDEQLSAALAFRGGTALHKLHLAPAARYSEDIDLVQVVAGPIGPTLTRLRTTLGWLGKAKSKASDSMASLTFSTRAELAPHRELKLKVEINTREHFAVDGYVERAFAVESPWFARATKLQTFSLEELLATKVRALYQRKKGRDLFDLWWACRAKPDWSRVVEMFGRYMTHEGHVVSSADFAKNVEEKLRDRAFVGDMGPLLRPAIHYDTAAAAEHALTLARSING
ncbi:MAG: nucleotidyl transferase AbiEii/AbiGii toxin family protein [Deltaproteobacteria bacterium]|nr:nucleotidyl transferase AbiEii/AbiGii toxin family protein [Deltaproteobacteria bacterium]